MALSVVAGCKMYPKRTTPKPPPLPSGFNPSVTNYIAPTRITSAISYIPSDFALTSVRLLNKTNVVLAWQNGTPPFQIQIRTNITDAWVNHGPATSQQSITNPAPSGKAFFRVQSVTGGTFQWAQQGRSANFQGFANSVAADGFGNVLYAGTFQGVMDFGSGLLPSVGKDNFIVKYSPDGALAWVKHFGGSLDEDLQGLAVDGLDNVFAIGSFAGTVNFGGGITLTSTPGLFSPSSDIFVAKYTQSGNTVWAKRFGGNQGETGYSVEVDAAGNAYIAGAFISTTISIGSITLTNGANSGRFFLAKLSSSGAVIWAKGWGGDGVSTPANLAIDKAGDLCVVGSFAGSTDLGAGPRPSAGGSDIFVAKYSAVDGSYRWSKTVGTASTASESGNGIAADLSNGNIVITGQYASAADFGVPIVDFGGSPNTVGGIFLVAYNASGTCLWAKTPNVAASGASDEKGHAVTIANGDIFYTGKCSSPVYFGFGFLSGGRDCFMASVNANGQPRWGKRSGGASGIGSDAAVSPGAVLFSGRVSSGTLNFDRLLGPSGGSVTTGQATIAPFVAQFSK